MIGATAPLGAAVVRRLLDDPAIEAVLGAGREPGPGALLPESPRFAYHPVDLARPRSLRELLFGPGRDLAVEAVIHCAQHRRASEGGGRIHAVNVEAVRELVQLCQRHPTVRRLVYRSFAEVYRVRADQPSLIAEDHPIDLSPELPQWIRDRAEADLAVCAFIGRSRLRIAVLRAAECLAPGTGSQLWDYLTSRVCFRPLGYDPMLNLISLEDLARALCLGLWGPEGVYNVPGRDTLPLSTLVERCGRLGVPVASFLLLPLYRARSLVLGTDFRYDLSRFRFHFSNVLSGRLARDLLGYEPETPLAFPQAAPPATVEAAAAGGFAEARPGEVTGVAEH